MIEKNNPFTASELDSADRYITVNEDEYFALVKKCYEANEVTENFYESVRLQRCEETEWNDIFDYFTRIYQELIHELQGRDETNGTSHVLATNDSRSNHLLDSGNVGVKRMVITDDGHYERSLEWLAKRAEQIESATSEAERAKLMENYNIVADALRMYSQPESMQTMKKALDEYL